MCAINHYIANNHDDMRVRPITYNEVNCKNICIAPIFFSKDHKMGGLKKKYLLSPSSGGWKSKAKFWQGRAPLKDIGKERFQASGCSPVFGPCKCSAPIFCLHIVFPLFLSVSMSEFPLFIWTPVILDQDPPYSSMSSS